MKDRKSAQEKGGNRAEQKHRHGFRCICKCRKESVFILRQQTLRFPPGEDEYVGEEHQCKEHEHDVISIIPQSDTLTDPWAVVIEFLHAIVADGAMTAPWWSGDHADITVLLFNLDTIYINNSLACCFFFQSTRVLVSGENPRVSGADHRQTPKNAYR